MLEALAAPMPALIAFLAGGALGLFFFGGLWWTVRRAALFVHPGVAVLASLLLRTGVTLAGFLVVAGGLWQRWLLCLMGFIVARWFLARALKPLAAEVRHAA